MTGDEWNMSGPAPREASADARTAAKQLREYFLALVAEGFTEVQALQVIGHVLRAGGGNATQ